MNEVLRFNKFFAVFFVVIVVFTITVSPAFSKNNVRIAIALFNAEAVEKYQHLGKTTAEVFKKQLEEELENAEIIVQNFEELKFLPGSGRETETIKKIIKEHKLDFLIWGKIERSSDGNFLLSVRLSGNSDSNSDLITKKTIESLPNIEALLSEVRTITTTLTSDMFENIIAEVNIVGNIRVEDDVILESIETKSGNNLERSTITNDIKTIYQMGFFKSVRVECKRSSEGIILYFKVRENPIINKVSFIGNNEVKEKKLQNIVNILKGSFLKITDVNAYVERIKSVYRSLDYHDFQVDYEIVRLEENRVDLKFNIAEGSKYPIKKICFIGNISFDETSLKKVIKSSEKTSFSWISNSGKLNSNTLLQDEQRLLAFYQNNGFVNVKVGKTKVNINDDHCNIIFFIEEGKRFRVGDFKLMGDLIEEEKKLLNILEAPKHEWFDNHLILQDVEKLTEIYLDEGFANAEITRKLNVNDDSSIEVTYLLKKNSVVNIREIQISGNLVTHDAVIRRQLRINENDVYNKNKISRSKNNILRLNFFEKVDVKHRKCQDDKYLDLNFEVIERPTGRISFGAGYSTTEKFFVSGSISKENFMGKGQTIKLSGTFGSDIDRYCLSFEEPWLFGIPLSGVTTLYKEKEEKPYYVSKNLELDEGESKNYKKIDTGIYLGLGYPLSDFARLLLSYNYNVLEEKSKEEKFEEISNSIAMNLSYDSREGKFYNPTKGSKHLLGCTYAGLGGDVSFIKLESSLGFYVPTTTKATLSLRGKYGYIKGLNPDKYRELGNHRLFYLGGMNSIRAYDYKTLGIDSGKMTIVDGKESISPIKGGNQYILFNLELLYPIDEELCLMGVVFYDAGEVFEDCPGNLKEGVGCGIRWYSPIGPIRVEAAYKLKDEDKGINWNISIGAPF